MLDSTEYTEIEGRLYPNPQVSLDESLSFIDNLRATQAQNTQQITQDTQRLGTDISSNLGGLTGGEGYFTSRYQTPQMNATAANLRATAQAAALNQALENEQAIWKNRYQQAYRNYQKRQYDASKTPTTTGGGGDGNNTTADKTTIEIVDVNTDPIAKSIYLRKFQEYIKQGMTAQEAEAQAKADLGLSD